jgi:hypothetical protein
MDATRAKILESFLTAYFTPFEEHIAALGDDAPIQTAESIVQEIAFQGLQAQFTMRSQMREVGVHGFTFYQDDWYYDSPQLTPFFGHHVEVFYNDKVDALWVILPNNLPCRVPRVTPAVNGDFYATPAGELAEEAA